MVASNGVKDVVHPRSIGFLLDDGFKIFVVPVNGPGTVLLNDVVLAVGRGGPHLLHTRPLAQLESRCSHPSCTPVDQDFVFGPKMTKVVEHVVSGHVGDRC